MDRMLQRAGLQLIGQGHRHHHRLRVIVSFISSHNASPLRANALYYIKPDSPSSISRQTTFSDSLNVTDETRAGERGLSPFELREMLSGEGTCELGHIPRVVLWRSGSALFLS